MPINEREICRIIQHIWATVLGLDVQPAVPDRRVESRSGFLTGSISIRGGWEGSAMLHCSAELARKAAAIMFSCPEPASADVRDALGELTNIAGGNIQALLADPCHLSLPCVVEAKHHRLRVAESLLFSRAFFRCQGEPLEVAILRRGTASRCTSPSGIAGHGPPLSSDPLAAAFHKTGPAPSAKKSTKVKGKV